MPSKATILGGLTDAAAGFKIGEAFVNVFRKMSDILKKKNRKGRLMC